MSHPCPANGCGMPMYLDGQAVVDAAWLASDHAKPRWWRCPSLNPKHAYWEHPEPIVAPTAPVGKVCQACFIRFKPDAGRLHRMCPDCRDKRRNQHSRARHHQRSDPHVGGF